MQALNFRSDERTEHVMLMLIYIYKYSKDPKIKKQRKQMWTIACVRIDWFGISAD